MSDIAIHALAKSFAPAGRNGELLPAVTGVSLEVAAGELAALVGPSGAGKTTLLRLIAGLETPDAGTIFIGGRDQSRIPPGERGVAMMFQTLALYPHLTARDNLAFGLRIRGARAADIEARIRETASRLDIGECLSRRPAELSSGQRQRVALGRALMRRPGVLLLDEPFANLDAPLRRELRGELQRLQQELGLTVLLVTHDQGEALALGKRVAVMHAGRIVQFATPAQLRAQPASEFVAAFLDPGAL